MITEISDGLYSISTETRYERQGSYNTYLIRADRDVLIDAGSSENCRQVISEALKALNVKKESLDFFSTHMHIDHAGSVEALGGPDSVFYIHEDADIFRDVSRRLDGYALCGLPREVSARLSLGSLSAPLPDNMRISYVRDGTELRFGNFDFRCVHTPGHSLEHTCLYDVKRKFLLSGDTILRSSVPYIPDYSADSDGVSAFMRTLDRLGSLDVKKILPGHGVLADYHEAVENTKKMLETDLIRQLSRLNSDPQSVTEILSGHGWDLCEMRSGTVCTIYFRIYALLNHLAKKNLAQRVVGEDGIHRFVRI